MRYFYTDPLAAAWMAKHFGMRFGIEHLGRTVWNCIGRIDEPWGPLTDPTDILDPISQHAKLLVHPDSLRLLDPQVGDLLDFHLAVDRYAICRENENDLSKLHHSFARYKVAEGDCRILQRNGKPFHWPESEPA